MTKPRPPKAYDHLKPRLDVHRAITDKIVAAIEAGAGAFQMPWHRPGLVFTIPKNAATQQPYRGSNVLSLWIDAEEKKFEHQVWATYRQWQEAGAQVRGGEKGSLIVKYGEWTRKTDAVAVSSTTPTSDVESDIDGTKRMFAKAAWVFNIDQVDADAALRAQVLPSAPARIDLTERLAHVDAFVAAIGVEVRDGGQRAFYRHRDSKGEGDFIQMPPRDLFMGTPTSTPTEAYYSTLLHEEIHASGAEHRLNRQHGQRFGDHAYAFEELVAELGAAFLCAELEITNTPRPDHAQYLAGWLEVLKGDTKAIFSAASFATRAVAWLADRQSSVAPSPADPEADAARAAARPDLSQKPAASSERGPKR